MDQGWIKLYRKLLESRVFQNEGLLKVWVWCLLKANHEGKWVSLKTGKGITEVWVNPGEFIFGRKKAAKELKMNPETIRKRTQKLKSMQNLTTQNKTHYTLVSIINWDTYQDKENELKNEFYQPGTNQVPQTRMIRNIYIGKYFCVTEPQHQKYGEAYPLLDLLGEYKEMDAWLESNPPKRKTERGYPRFVNGWLSRAYKKLQEKKESDQGNWFDKYPEL